jgi:galactonate dehydratase
MKITAVKTFLLRPARPSEGWNVAKHFLLVKVETDEGIHGWGESFTLVDREKAIAGLVGSLARYLTGRDPFQIKAFVRAAVTRFAEGRPSVELFSAVSGIEQALWDIVGKALGAPVYNLLGGPCRDRIRVYANGWTSGARTAGEMADRAERVVGLGFDAIKLYPFQNDEDERGIVRNVAAVREAVGPKVDLLIDVWRQPDPVKAIRVARMLEEHNVFWYEEPVPSDNLDLLAEVKRAIRLPVVTGECLYTKSEFRQVLEKRAADILNPDVANCSGILELREISAMAEPYGVRVSPHNYNSTSLGLAATIQVSAVIPNFVITEYFVNFRETGDALCLTPFRVEGGAIRLPEGPGLGVEIDEAALGRFPYEEFAVRKLF